MNVTLQTYLYPASTPLLPPMSFIQNRFDFNNTDQINMLSNYVMRAINETEKRLAVYSPEYQNNDKETEITKPKKNKRDIFKTLIKDLNNHKINTDQAQLGCLNSHFKKPIIPPTFAFMNSEMYDNLLNTDDVNAKGKDGITALMYAVSTTDTADMVGPLCNAEADANLRDNEGCTALIWFIKSTFETLRNKSNLNLDQKHSIINTLQNCKADINIPDNAGNSPLMYAVMSDKYIIVQKLNKLGADVYLANDAGETAMHLAVKYKVHRSVFDALNNRMPIISIKDKNGHTPFMLAAFGGDKDLMETFLSRNADINDTDAKEWTVLMHAANCGDIETVEYLISKQAEVNFENTLAQSALKIALARGYDEIKNALVKAGASIIEKQVSIGAEVQVECKSLDALENAATEQIAFNVGVVPKMIPVWITRGVKDFYQSIKQVVTPRTTG